MPHQAFEQVTIRPPTYSDAEQMRDLLIINKSRTLPGYDAHNRDRINFWMAKGVSLFVELIEQTLRNPDRYFVRVASLGSRVIGYARGSIVDAETIRKPIWRHLDPADRWEGFDPYVARALPRAECYNSCDGLMVDPKFQRIGLGRRLSIDRLALMFRQPTKFYPVRSFVPDTNLPSQAFHRRLGFEPVDCFEPTAIMPAHIITMELDVNSHAGRNTYYQAVNCNMAASSQFTLFCTPHTIAT